jgi:hypothetical protein
MTTIVKVIKNSKRSLFIFFFIFCLFENLYACHGKAAANGPTTSGTPPPVGSPTSTPAASSSETPQGAITPSGIHRINKRR